MLFKLKQLSLCYQKVKITLFNSRIPTTYCANTSVNMGQIKAVFSADNSKARVSARSPAAMNDECYCIMIVIMTLLGEPGVYLPVAHAHRTPPDLQTATPERTELAYRSTAIFTRL